MRTRRAAIARLARTLAASASDAELQGVTTRHAAGEASYEIALGHVDRSEALPRRRSDRRLELRAAFLACGSLAAPARGYHLEFVPPPGAYERLERLLRSEGLAPRLLQRRGREVIYFKEIDAIGRLLAAIGAAVTLLYLEDVRARKETKNRIRRLVNTEAANAERAGAAAAEQGALIARVLERRSLASLPPALREFAELRLSHPSETLAELGRRARPAVGKATIARRIAALARIERSHGGSEAPLGGARRKGSRAATR